MVKKYYINYNKKERECSICREIKDFSKFNYNNTKYTKYTSRCKNCTNLLAKQNRKYIINKKYNYINDNQKICSKCAQSKQLSMFYKNGKTITSYCKPCHSKYTYRIKLEKMIELYPNRYIECSNEDCGHIWAIRKNKLGNCKKCNK